MQADEFHFYLRLVWLGILLFASIYFQKDVVCLISENRELAHKHEHNLAALLWLRTLNSPCSVHHEDLTLHGFFCFPLCHPSELPSTPRMGLLIHIPSILYLFVTAFIMIVIE